VLQERAILREWVERVVAEPALLLRDPADLDLVHALGLVPEREGRVLRVVYNQMIDPPRIVTAFFDRSMRGKL
jgi:hypothetical protein